ncbi:uncharacterized protein PAE49_003255 [Odontesthes bonariensis]|uniref:uncharacterized protein LOC142377887 n=1 Tax=Odontesthes bonariensis TaxID=219752 RepID=UPI003F586E2A
MATIFRPLVCCLLLLFIAESQMETPNTDFQTHYSMRSTSNESEHVTDFNETQHSSTETVSEKVPTATGPTESTGQSTGTESTTMDSEKVPTATGPTESTGQSTGTESTTMDSAKVPTATGPTESTGQSTGTESTTMDSEKVPTATGPTESTGQSTGTESTTNSTPSLKTTTLSSETPTFTTVTTHATKTTTSYISTPKASVNPAENSSHTVSAATDSVDRTHGSSLNKSEKSMVIIFSAVLGVFAVAMAGIMFHKYKHKFQYMHQPIYNTDDADGFVADGDTLVISGGLYDGHPIYDNVAPDPADQSQFRLEFL